MTFDEFRATAIAAFKTLHDANYPAITAEYPNQLVVDIEKETDDWVRVEIAINSHKQLCFGQRYTRVSGWFYISTFVRRGGGTIWQTQYTDFLDTNFSLQVIDDITFKEVLPLPGVGYPAWHVVRNSLPFTFEKYN